ncbi:hypothetical protein ACT6QG_05200 [Xanthobacter sp. TB0136]|uniref:hypothetical protein n=1 Tax=Xanthobacter sp. TB0136 TaxID=3459177 RepID=UPI004039AE5D
MAVRNTGAGLRPSTATRARLNAVAAAGELVAGELIWITNESRMVQATSTTEWREIAHAGQIPTVPEFATPAEAVAGVATGKIMDPANVALAIAALAGGTTVVLNEFTQSGTFTKDADDALYFVVTVDGGGGGGGGGGGRNGGSITNANGNGGKGGGANGASGASGSKDTGGNGGGGGSGSAVLGIIPAAWLPATVNVIVGAGGAGGAGGAKASGGGSAGTAGTAGGASSFSDALLVLKTVTGAGSGMVGGTIDLPFLPQIGVGFGGNGGAGGGNYTDGSRGTDGAGGAVFVWRLKA